LVFSNVYLVIKNIIRSIIIIIFLLYQLLQVDKKRKKKKEKTNYLFILKFYKGAKCRQKVENYYNCEIWNRDVYKPYFNATERLRRTTLM
jgi:hypothetical protein